MGALPKRATMPPLEFEHGDVLPPLVTPFDGDDEVDADALASLVDELVEAGLAGMVPCGTTGEFASLSDEEYRTVVETTAEAADGRVPVVAGAADTTVDGVVRRLRVAREVGADAGMVTLPYFHGSTAPAGQRAFLRAVADDAPLPVFLYDIPSCVGEAIDPGVVGDLAGHDSVVGLKDSGGDLTALQATLRATPEEFTVFQGFDNHLFPTLDLGVTGGINALSQAIPEAYVAVGEAVRAGDRERALRVHREAIEPLFEHCFDHGFAPVAKAATAERGFLPDATCRPPLVDLDAEARRAVGETVDDALDAV